MTTNNAAPAEAESNNHRALRLGRGPRSGWRHTPGPWATDGREAGWNILDPAGERVATVWRDGPNQPANARLIAAAPELLVALQKVVNRASHAKPDSTGQEMRAIRLALVDELRAVVAKATGGQP